MSMWWFVLPWVMVLSALAVSLLHDLGLGWDTWHPNRPKVVGDLVLWPIILPGLVLIVFFMGVQKLIMLPLPKMPTEKVCPYCKLSDCYGMRTKCVKGVTPNA